MNLVRAQKPKRLRVVLTPDEVRAVIERCRAGGEAGRALLYGSGLRLVEALTLRVKHVDFWWGSW